MKIFIGSDHAGFALKEHIAKYLLKKKYKVVDFSKKVKPGDDYPDVANIVAKKVQSNRQAFGILLCGSGHGVCMAANRSKGIRAALGYEVRSIRAGRLEDNINILCLSGRYLSQAQAEKITLSFLTTKFSTKPRYAKRLKKF